VKTLVFDTETTGLIDNHVLRMDRQPEVIEFAGLLVDLDTGEPSEEYETMVRPQRSLDDKIKKITGIVDEDLRDKPRFSEVSSRIKALIEGSQAVLAHNLSFDMEMLDFEFERLGQSLTWPAIKICTIEQTSHLQGFRMNLSMLHQHLLGFRHVDAHRAMADVKALLRCAVELRRRELL
jgi:DNA polymerase-3 subunit epsilon